MSTTYRNWMYERLDVHGHISHVFRKGVNTFIDFASSKQSYMDGDKVRCPCTTCNNKAYEVVDIVKFHLYKFGFVPNYKIWDKHGETSIESTSLGVDDTNTSLNEHHEPTYTEMVMDAAGPDFITKTLAEEPNLEDKKFFDMLEAADKELWPGCEKVTQLSVVARLLNIKSEYRIPEQCFDAICQLIKDALPEENNMVDNIYETKKLIQALCLPVERIDCCRSGCMLYWRGDKDLDRCKFCDAPRFKLLRSSSSKRSRIPYTRMHYLPLIPRLKRLYASQATAASMRWHAEDHGHDGGVMCHPSDSEAWKHFDISYPSFAAETRNVRLGLCTDGFQPHGASGKQYSSWPIIITPYNLPPSMCLKEPYMFLTAVVPGPENPKQRIDVFLQPVIAELKQLWEEGVLTYDVSLRQNFQMRAALMWTISDFPAYGMLSGWSTAGRLACPHCGKYSQAFRLDNGKKMSWFDCHRRFLDTNHTFRNDKNNFIKNRVETEGPPPIMNGAEILKQIEDFGLLKVTEVDAEVVNKSCGSNDECGWKKRSIFWDFPYWKTNLIRHNLDVMHIEKNVFENLFYTIMDVKKKTKDNSNARDDMRVFCKKRKGVENYERAYYALDKSQKKAICEWVEALRFPDGYVSNLGRCVDLRKCRLFGMKSHDCHVFMQRLLPIAFREMLPRNVWEAITELSLFFKSLTSTVITTEDMERIEAEIPIILCKLEKIFVPALFDSMEHLPIHLPYEAKIAGPVQYRWMYPFERLLHELKKDVKNKARVEGSIVNAFLVRETSNFCSYYFEPSVYTRNRKVPRNDDGGAKDNHDDTLAIFSHPGRLYGKLKSRRLTEQEFDAAHSYILVNEEKVQPYLIMYEDWLKELSPDISEQDLAAEVDKNFASWFENYARKNVIKNKYIHDLSRKPLRTVKSYKVYFVNGFKFHTESHGDNKSTMNSGVCISSSFGDYYGRLLEILEIEYPALPIKTTILFKCHWYDPTPNVGVKVHNHYKLVDINSKIKFNKFEPFVLAMQATQVCFMPYPSLKKKKSEWLAVCKVRPWGWAVVRKKDAAFQEDEVEANEIINTTREDEVDDISSNESDDENNDDDECEFDDENNDDDECEFDDENNDEDDGEGEFEYSTSTGEEDDEEDD